MLDLLDDTRKAHAASGPAIEPARSAIEPDHAPPAGDISAGLARREALLALRISACAFGGFALAASRFEDAAWQFVVVVAIALPLAVVRSVRTSSRRVPARAPATLPADVRVRSDGEPRAGSRLVGPGAAAWTIVAAEAGYGFGWLCGHGDTITAGGVALFAVLVTHVISLAQVLRWERRHGLELLWVGEEGRETLPCVRGAERRPAAQSST